MTQYPYNLYKNHRIKSNYNAVRQQELKGILSFQEAQRSYSQVSDALLSILNDLHSGRVP